MSDAPALLAERLAAQLLTEPSSGGPLAVCERLLAVQAQDGRGARLAVRARATGTVAADVDRALSEERSLLVTWLNRGTLHLVRTEDYPWLQALTTPPLLTGNARRLAQEGVSASDAERGARVIIAALASDGPLTRAQLRERLDSAGVRTAGQAMVHLLAYASLRGHIVRGPMVGRQHAFVLVRDWLGELPAVDRDRALADLARRYLAGHGPASDRDLARWSGLPLRDARAGLGAIARRLSGRGDGRVNLRGLRTPNGLPPPRLLGAFDPVLLGWTAREPLLRQADDGIVVNGGMFRPCALVEGRVVATWSLVSGRVVLSPFVALTARQASALEADAGEVRRYLGLR